MRKELNECFDKDCGCPIREVQLWPYEVQMHLDFNGIGEAVFCLEEFVFEESFLATTMDELELKVRDFIVTEGKDNA